MWMRCGREVAYKVAPYKQPISPFFSLCHTRSCTQTDFFTSWKLTKAEFIRMAPDLTLLLRESFFFGTWFIDGTALTSLDKQP
jgi:hypothetical protein